MSVSRLEDTSGSLASGYKETLRALDNLLGEFNSLVKNNQIPTSPSLDQAINGALLAMQLGLLHFPSGTYPGIWGSDEDQA